MYYTSCVVLIDFPRVTFDSKGAVEEYIAQQNATITSVNNQIRLMVGSGLRGLATPEEDVVDWTDRKLSDLLEEYENAVWWKSRASSVLEHWDDLHDENGLAKDGKVPVTGKGYLDDFQRMDGDYIRTVSNPDLSLED